MAYHVLVQKATRTDVPVILPPAPFFLAIQAYEIMLPSSKTKRDTNRRRVKIVLHVPTGALRHKKIASPHLVQHPFLKMHFFCYGNSRWDIPRLQHARRRYIRHAYGATHSAPTRLPVGIEGVTTHALTSLFRVSAEVLCFSSNGDWRYRSLKKNLKFESSRIKLVGLGRCELLC